MATYEIAECQKASIVAMSEAGYTDKQIIDSCKVSQRTVSRYKVKNRNCNGVGLVKPAILATIKEDIENRALLKTSRNLSLLENANLPPIDNYRDYKDMSISFGIMHQHYRLASGQNNEMNSGLNVMARFLEGLEAKIRKNKTKTIDVKVSK